MTAERSGKLVITLGSCHVSGAFCTEVAGTELVDLGQSEE
jgi:hypothetical protein